MIINENELKHEMRSKSDKIHKLMKSLCNKLKIKFLAVTRGSSGVILYNKSKNSFYYSEAFADKIVDKVGADDAADLQVATTCNTVQEGEDNHLYDQKDEIHNPHETHKAGNRVRSGRPTP